MIWYILRSLVEWVLRRRPLGLALIKLGIPLLAAVLVSLTFGLTISTSNGPIILSWDTSGGTATLSWAVFSIAAIVVLLGAALIIRDVRLEDRKKVIVMEVRGLRDGQGEPLVEAVPTSIKGRRYPLIIDIRQGLIDGQIIDPNVAIQRLSGLPADIARHCDGLNRADVSLVVGGLAPVPFLFLLGVIIDDESSARIMDWDRKGKIWRTLDEEDDGKRFTISGLNAVTVGTTHVALCVSASYDVLNENVRIIEPIAPIIRMDLEGRSTASHWSEHKQQQLAQQFLDLVMEFSRRGVTDIALFLAAPPSISLRLGTVYDKRNLPGITVNQYEQGDAKKFPWAIRMPVAGLVIPTLEQR